MSKRAQSNQNFSLRRIFFRTVRLTESNRNQRLNDVECGGMPKAESSETAKNDLHSTKSSSFCEQSAVGVGSMIDAVCNICFLNESPDVPFFTLELCGHKFCTACLTKYLKNEISESRTDIACPQCSSGIHPNNIEHLLHDLQDIKNKYQDFMIRRYLVNDPDCRWCPAPDCTYAVIATGCASCPEIRCERPNCGMSFCYHCKAIWHPDQTCDAARNSRQKSLHTSSIDFSQDLRKSDEIKPCPRCQVLIVKMNDGSCNHMACSLCGAEFCWLCMKEVSDLHYLSPSGCTFWGKKPWSRKKKIVWQIGTLIGAPVGIALLAGIAVPSIVIGIPVWTGRKLLNRYKTTSKKKRNISVAIGVTASILVSPILAGLAIAVGVPILLFYVYGIVPVSLIRAGCRNVNSEDYKFDGDITDHNKSQAKVDNASLGIGSKIEETSIGDVSLSGVSGSIIETDNADFCINQLSNRESNIALAGSVQVNKHDFTDNISSKSPSALTSNSNKTICNETASNIVLAGSLTSYKM